MLFVVNFSVMGRNLTQVVETFFLSALEADNFVWNDLVFLQGERLNFCAREALDNPALLKPFRLGNLLVDDLNNNFVVDYKGNAPSNRPFQIVE